MKYKSDVDAAAVGVRAGLNLAALFGILALPIIPETGEKILDALGIPEANRTMKFGTGADYAALLDAMPRGHAITPPDVLFQKIEDEQVAAWTEQFGGGNPA